MSFLLHVECVTLLIIIYHFFSPPQILLQVPKIGSTVNRDEIFGSQQELTEEITILLLWQGGETELLTSN